MHEFHHHVGRRVGLEKAHDADDVGMPEGRQRARLIEKARQAPFEGWPVLVARWAYRRVVITQGDIGGQILLDRHRQIEVLVGGEISEAESTDAQQLVEAVFVDDVPRGEAGDIWTG